MRCEQTEPKSNAPPALSMECFEMDGVDWETVTYRGPIERNWDCTGPSWSWL